MNLWYKEHQQATKAKSAMTALLSAKLEWSQSALDRLGSISLTHVMLVVGGLLAVVCPVLLRSAKARLRRARLILD